MNRQTASKATAMQELSIQCPSEDGSQWIINLNASCMMKQHQNGQIIYTLRLPENIQTQEDAQNILHQYFKAGDEIPFQSTLLQKGYYVESTQ